MVMRKIKKGDMVVITTGDDKGQSGKVLGFVGRDRVLVEGINLVKKHVKPNPKNEEKGGIREQEASVHVSNVAVFDAVAKKVGRIGFKILADGKKVRCFKSSGEMLDV